MSRRTLPFRTGIGYDVHRLVSGRDLILGGVRFDSPVGLDGHSDADVLCHAIADAVLGALALGDIGHHFPPGDPQWAGADSIELLRAAVSLARERGWEVGNVDATVIAEAPKVNPRADEMRARLADALDIDVDSVSLKATTNELLGAIGRSEGIAALAVATMVRDDEVTG
ncbi:MAG TPA: 2-C-methyl-D-erythritol 2,4-cyclodiphosphate synthase [Thermomicrobiales bacterium]|jgi:2-C-methyl-D-erythritol 2,4-cyclodiphosphate synthase|nr:2-C-methyl-D-erythritol 2,4-cyclodiphosphate synthase [Thermomicrobiales bacterium]